MSLVECEDLFGVDFNVIEDFEGKEFRVHKTLAANILMKVWWARKYSGDCIFFIGGSEGSGKSTLARQLGKLISKHFSSGIPFSEKNIVFDFNSLKSRFYNGVDWEVINYDESQEGVDRLNFSSNENKDFNAFMRQSRQAHKILIMCGPSIYDISSYVAQHRVNFLIQCYKHDNIHPGYFMFFNEALIHELFIYDKKERKYTRKANFIGNFGKAEVCDMFVYNAKKKAAFEKFRPGAHEVSDAAPKTPEEIIRDWKISRLRAWEAMKNKSKGLRVKDVCVTLDIGRTVFYEWCDKYGIEIKNAPGRVSVRYTETDEVLEGEDNLYISGDREVT